LLGVSALVVILAFALLAMGQASWARGYAQTAADLAALSGAAAHRLGVNGCEVAELTVDRLRGTGVASAKLVECTTADTVITVVASVTSADVYGWVIGEVRATARAGPKAQVG
jgi:secretion/DNA translocation related TadE-like protein